MMVNCPVCGKLTAIHWPQHWIYRRGDAYYCSWNCLDVDITKDLKLMHEVQRKRRERKMYNKLKKDGTPAKKSGPKPKKVEVPEPVSGGPWEKMETPEDYVKLTGPIRIETEEPKKIDVLTPEMMNEAQRTAKRLLNDARKEKEKDFGLPSYIDGFEIVGIEGQFGAYRASAEHNYFEFIPFGGDLCMNPGDWREQIEELHKAAKVLGVKL